MTQRPTFTTTHRALMGTGYCSSHGQRKELCLFGRPQQVIVARTA